MLSPNYLAHLPDALVKLWQQCEDDILLDVARRLGLYGELTETANWQLWRLEQTRLLKSDIVKKLAKYTGKSDKEIRRILTEAGTQALAADDAIYTAAGVKDLPALNDSPALLNLLNAGYAQTAGTWHNLTATTANTVTQQFENALDRAHMQVTSGGFDYNTSIRRAVLDLADHMDYVKYPTGHTDTLEVASRRAVLTGVNQTAAKLQIERMNQAGWEYVEVTAHAGARPSHAVWQGKVYHVGGRIVKDGKVYEDFKESTGYGTGPGLCGWNCRHSFGPFWPNLSERAWTDKELSALDEKTITYNGEKYTEYEISQMQRALERKVRKYKREYMSLDAAGQDATAQAVKLRAARQALKDFTRETHQQNDSSRTFVAGFGHSQASKATAAAKKGAK